MMPAQLYQSLKLDYDLLYLITHQLLQMYTKNLFMQKYQPLNLQHCEHHYLIHQLLIYDKPILMLKCLILKLHYDLSQLVLQLFMISTMNYFYQPQYSKTQQPYCHYWLYLGLNIHLKLKLSFKYYNISILLTFNVLVLSKVLHDKCYVSYNVEPCTFLNFLNIICSSIYLKFTVHINRTNQNTTMYTNLLTR